jgi:hypothetical protein
VWEAVHQNGGGCDYIDEKVLQNSRFSNGKLYYGPRSYKVLLLLEVETIEPQTAKALQKFVENGGLVLFIEREPHKAPGLENHKKGDRIVKETIDSLKRDFPKNAVSYHAPKQEIIQWYADIQSTFKIKPPVQFDKPVKHVSQVYYKTKDADIFFISNYHLEKPHDFTATFDIEDKIPWIWDPETGKKYIYPHTNSPNELKIHLDPSESLLIVFINEKGGDVFPIIKREKPSPLFIKGSWNVKLYKVDEPGPPVKRVLKELIDFKENNTLKSFGGYIFYENNFEVTKPENFTYLDLGKVYNISEVWLNDQNMGFRWYGRHIYNVKNVLKAGNNTLKVKVTTILGNYTKSLTGNKEVQKWVRNQPYYSCGLIGPVKLY